MKASSEKKAEPQKLKKIEAVFISDLHLHPEDKAIKARFDAFIAWAANATKKLYIPGDFFHAWPGDDAMDAWSRGIALQIKSLSDAGVEVYYMHGNRDFLLGPDFAVVAGWTVLSEPAVIHCGNIPVLLVHGDGYCTDDRSHQCFRRLTRNRFFCAIFKHIPLGLRCRLVGVVRNRRYNKSPEQMDVVQEAFIADMQLHQVTHLIHGHTHRQNLHEYNINGIIFKRFVLSDWDDNPIFLCYDEASGFYFNHFGALSGGIADVEKN